MMLELDESEAAAVALALVAFIHDPDPTNDRWRDNASVVGLRLNDLRNNDE